MVTVEYNATIRELYSMVADHFKISVKDVVASPDS